MKHSPSANGLGCRPIAPRLRPQRPRFPASAANASSQAATTSQRRVLDRVEDLAGVPSPFVLPNDNTTPIIGGFLGTTELDFLRPFKQLPEVYRKYDQEVMIWSVIGVNLVCLRGAEDISFVLKNQEAFVKTKNLEFMKDFMGTGLVMQADIGKHRRQRETLNPGFRSDYIRSLSPVFARAAEELSAIALERGEVDVQDLCRRLTLDIIGRAGFKYDFNSLANARKGASPVDPSEDIPKIWNQILNFCQILVALPPAPIPIFLIPGHKDYIDGVRNIEKRIYEVLEARAKQGVQDDDRDLLGFMIRERQRQVQSGEEAWLNDKLMRDELMTMAFAGSDTTSNVLVWLFFMAATRPDIAAKIKAELAANFGPGPIADSALTSEAVNKLSYLNATIYEVLRLWPSAPETARLAAKPAILGGRAVQPGQVVYISIYALHRNENVWPRADEFLPERFLPGHEDLAARHPDAWLPFSTGPRGCIGRGFALLEAVTVAASVLSRIDLSRDPSLGAPSEGQGLTMCVEGGMVLRAKASTP